MKFDMGEAWRDAMAMIAANREVLLIVAGIFFFLPSLVTAFTLPDMQSLMMGTDDPEQVMETAMAIYADFAWIFVVVSLLQVVGYLALLALLRDANKPTVGEAIKAGFKGLLPAIGAYLIVSVGFGIVALVVAMVMVATESIALATLVILLAVPVALYVWVKLSLSPAVIAIDKVSNPLKILGNSWRLTKGNSFRLVLFYLLIFVVYIVASLLMGMILAVFFLLGQDIGLILNGVASGLLGAVVSVVFVAVIASVHRQLSGPSVDAVRETFE